MRSRARALAALILGSLLVTSCGQTPDARMQDYAPPAAVAAGAAPEGAPEPEKRESALTFAIWSPNEIDRSLLHDAAGMEGVRSVGEVALGTVTVRARGRGPKEISAIAVDPQPLTYEPVFARVAASLVAGDAALNAAAVALRGISPGSTVRVSSEARGLSMRVGSIVGADTLFDHELVLPIARASMLGMNGMRALLVAVAPESFEDVSARLVERAGEGARVRALQDVDADEGTVLDPEQIKKYFGSFSYVRGPGDSIVQDPRWVKAAIIDWKIPVVGWVRCHRNIIGQLAYAMWDVERAGLAKEIESYDGCYVARMQRQDDSRLSAHAYGIAIDLNAASNAQGDDTPAMDPRIVRIMKKWGFYWGGNFDTTDGMHFEFERFVKPRT